MLVFVPLQLACFLGRAFVLRHGGKLHGVLMMLFSRRLFPSGCAFILGGRRPLIESSSGEDEWVGRIAVGVEEAFFLVNSRRPYGFRSESHASWRIPPPGRGRVQERQEREERQEEERRGRREEMKEEVRSKKSKKAKRKKNKSGVSTLVVFRMDSPLEAICHRTVLPMNTAQIYIYIYIQISLCTRDLVEQCQALVG